MTRSDRQASPPPLRDYESEIYDLVHIATLLRAVTDEGGSIPPDITGAVSFLAYLASDRLEILSTALNGGTT